MIGAHELTIKAGITYRQLDFWTRSGLLQADRPTVPDIRQQHGSVGSGYPRTYSTEQARICIAMARLVRAGINPREARPMAEQMLRTGEASIGEFKVTVPKPVRRRGWHLAGRRAA